MIREPSKKIEISAHTDPGKIESARARLSTQTGKFKKTAKRLRQVHSYLREWNGFRPEHLNQGITI